MNNQCDNCGNPYLTAEWEAALAERDERIKELERLVEDMKCCKNCADHNVLVTDEPCVNCDPQEKDNKWRMREFWGGVDAEYVVLDERDAEIARLRKALEEIADIGSDEPHCSWVAEKALEGKK